jgi:hypothetical protein
MQHAVLMRRARVIVAAAFATTALGAASCGDDAPTGARNTEAAGSYVLTTITQGGTSCAVSPAGCTIENTGSDVVVVTDGSMSLLADGAFTLGATGVENDLGVEWEVGGAWTQSGSVVSFTVPGLPAAIPAQSAAGTLTFSVPGGLFSSAQQLVTVTFERE